MNLDLDITDPIRRKDWDDLVLELPTSSFFYTSLWAKVLSETYHYAPMYFNIISQNRLEFLVPVMSIKSKITGNRGVSLPFTDYCDPFIMRQQKFEPLLKQIFEIGKNRGWKYLEFRGGGTLFSDKTPSMSYYIHSLDLTDESALYGRLKSNTKRNINKAKKEGVRISIDNSSMMMESFYRLNCITRKKHGLPPQPITFFKNVHEYIIKNDFGTIVSALYKNNIIAAAIYFHFKDTAIYKYGASDLEHLPLRANNLVMWEAIQYYAQKGFKQLNFGKTETGNQGLRRYKLGWGTEEETLLYFKYDFLQERFVEDQGKEAGWYNFFFKNMPLPVLKKAGTLLYKHVG